MNKLPFFLALILLLSIGCKPKPKGGELTNTYWTLIALSNGRKVINLNPDSRITAVVNNNSISGDCICNSYSSNIKIDGPKLNIIEIITTENACDGLDLENNYLGLLMKASGYTVLKDKMEIYSENGKLTFRPMSEAETASYKLQLLSKKLDELFPEFRSDSSLHLYPIINVDKPGTYPYSGIMIDPSFYEVFDESMSEIWRNSGGEVFAVGKYADLYICRVPGRYVPSDIAIFRLENKILKHYGTIAWAWCDEGWCNQQDAWIQHVNGDGLPDIVQHFEYRDSKNKLKEERLSLLLQNEKGEFVPNTDLRLNKSNFKLAKI